MYLVKPEYRVANLIIALSNKEYKKRKGLSKLFFMGLDTIFLERAKQIKTK